jgi:hypothetical protein
MAKKSETSFRENTVYPALDALPNTYYFSIQQVAIVADPDIILCIQGRFCALELKGHKDDRIAKLQEYKLEKVRKSGGVAFRADRSNWKEVHAELLKLAMEKPNGKKRTS